MSSCISSDMSGENCPCGSDEVGLIGCCGAYCRTCRSLILGSCKGCKLGYDDGTRDMARARCKIKVCCFGTKELETCAECPDSGDCPLLKRFFSKGGGKYDRYKRILEFIRANGYSEFVKRGKDWKNSYGKL